MNKPLSYRVDKLMTSHRLTRKEMQTELNCGQRTLIRIIKGELDYIKAGQHYLKIIEDMEKNGPRFSNQLKPLDKSGIKKMAELEKRIVEIETILRMNKML